MKQVTDLGAIEKVVDEIIAGNPDKVARCEDQSEGDRLVRRPGDEGVRRQGQSAGGQRRCSRASSVSERRARGLPRATNFCVFAVASVARRARADESDGADLRAFDRIRVGAKHRMTFCGKKFLSGQIRHGSPALVHRAPLCASPLRSNLDAWRRAANPRKAKVYRGFWRVAKFSRASEQLRSIVQAAHIARLEPSANRTIFARAYTLR